MELWEADGAQSRSQADGFLGLLDTPSVALAMTGSSLTNEGWARLANTAGYDEAPADPEIAAEFSALSADPGDNERFEALWPYLTSERTTWESDYAALPHLVRVIAQREPSERGELLSVVGIVICGECDDVPADSNRHTAKPKLRSTL